MDSRELITELGFIVVSGLWKYVIPNRNNKKQDLLSHHYDIVDLKDVQVVLYDAPYFIR